MDVKDVRGEYQVEPVSAAGKDDVQPGYKRTEAGIIPEDWDIRRLADVAEANWGNTATTKRAYQESGFQAFSAAGPDGFVAWCEHREPAVVLSAIGALCGKTWLTGPEWTAIKNTIWFRGDGLNVETAFLFRITANSDFWIKRGQAQPFIALGDVRNARLALPPLREQCAIAKALSDADALLGALDRLIVKKRDLKQAAMQQLLTGQTRLPAFHGEWKVKTLGEVFLITVGTSKSSSIVKNGDHWIVDMGSVSVRGELVVSKQTNLSSDFLCVGDLVMPKDDIGGGGIIGRVGYIDADEKYVLGDHVYCLRATEGDPRFLAYIINSQAVNHALRKKVIGSAQLGLGRRSVTDQEIPFPDVDEQAAIAAAFSDMDAEIDALEARRAKTLDLKQAMMQELLTGRTRLV
jgi:type I restriction enzyme S subunit